MLQIMNSLLDNASDVESANQVFRKASHFEAIGRKLQKNEYFQKNLILWKIPEEVVGKVVAIEKDLRKAFMPPNSSVLVFYMSNKTLRIQKPNYFSYFCIYHYKSVTNWSEYINVKRQFCRKYHKKCPNFLPIKYIKLSVPSQKSRTSRNFFLQY